MKLNQELKNQIDQGYQFRQFENESKEEKSPWEKLISREDHFLNRPIERINNKVVFKPPSSLK